MRKFVLTVIVVAFAVIATNAGEKTQTPAKTQAAKPQAPAKAEPKPQAAVPVKGEKALVPLKLGEKLRLKLYKESNLLVIPCDECKGRRRLFTQKEVKPTK